MDWDNEKIMVRQENQKLSYILRVLRCASLEFTSPNQQSVGGAYETMASRLRVGNNPGHDNKPTRSESRYDDEAKSRRLIK